MATVDRWSSASVLVGLGVALLMAASARADDAVGNSTVLARPVPSTSAPGSGAPLVGLEQSGAFSLVPPGSASAARNDGLAGAPGGVDLSYVPPAERDSYLNSRDFADHQNALSRPARHPSALSQLGGLAESLAINGALGAGTSLVLGAH